MQARLAQFLTRKINELFVFVQYPEVSRENNPAERAIRPLVITRTVRGGMRSAQGSRTTMILLSLPHIAHVRGWDAVASLAQTLLGTLMFLASA